VVNEVCVTLEGKAGFGLNFVDESGKDFNQCRPGPELVLR